jgi:hypothetical protein
MSKYFEKIFNLPSVIILFLLLSTLGSRELWGQIVNSKNLSQPNTIQTRKAFNIVGKSCHVKVQRVNVRSTPNGEVIGTLNYADSVVNKGAKGSWIKIDNGFVYGEHLNCWQPISSIIQVSPK